MRRHQHIDEWLPRAIRQAKETNYQLKKEVEDARLRIHAEVIANWAQLQAAASEIQSAQDGFVHERSPARGASTGLLVRCTVVVWSATSDQAETG
jgi:outer membrane protein TolC